MRATLKQSARVAVDEAKEHVLAALQACDEALRTDELTIYWPLAASALQLAQLAVKRASLLHELSLRPSGIVERV